MPEQKVYVVIGGTDYNGEDFDTLKLFDCLSTAQKYSESLINDEGMNYALLDTRIINMESQFSNAG